MADGSEATKAPQPPVTTGASTQAPPVKKRKALSLDIKDLSEVIERKISPAA